MKAKAGAAKDVAQGGALQQVWYFSRLATRRDDHVNARKATSRAPQKSEEKDRKGKCYDGL